MIRSVITALVALLVLAACGGLAALPGGPLVPVEPSVPVGADDTCGAGPNAALVGQSVAALERVLIMRQIRVIRPGDAVTMDFRAERINFEIDSTDRIARIFCG